MGFVTVIMSRKEIGSRLFLGKSSFIFWPYSVHVSLRKKVTLSISQRKKKRKKEKGSQIWESARDRLKYFKRTKFILIFKIHTKMTLRGIMFERWISLAIKMVRNMDFLKMSFFICSDLSLLLISNYVL